MRYVAGLPDPNALPRPELPALDSAELTLAVLPSGRLAWHSAEGEHIVRAEPEFHAWSFERGRRLFRAEARVVCLECSHQAQASIPLAPLLLSEVDLVPASLTRLDADARAELRRLLPACPGG